MKDDDMKTGDPKQETMVSIRAKLPGFTRWAQGVAPVLVENLLTEELLGKMLDKLKDLSTEYDTIKEEGFVSCVVKKRSILWDTIRKVMPQPILKFMYKLEEDKTLEETKNIVNLYMAFLINKSITW